MEYEQIIKLAEENEISTFFKELYKHSIKVLTKIPKERMKEMLTEAVECKPNDVLESEYKVVQGIY